MLSTVAGAVTEASEPVDGKPAWRVAATADAAHLKAMIPGVAGTVPGKLWIDAADKRVLKSTFTLPGGTVTVTFTKFDAPAQISAP